MKKENLWKALAWAGDHVAKQAVCSASAFCWNQPKEPEAAREKYLKTGLQETK